MGRYQRLVLCGVAGQDDGASLRDSSQRGESSGITILAAHVRLIHSQLPTPIHGSSTTIYVEVKDSSEFVVPQAV